MERKRIVCEHCRQSIDIMRDFTTGLWELSIGHSKISWLSWEALGKNWLESHSRECRVNPIQAAATS